MKVNRVTGKQAPDAKDFLSKTPCCNLYVLHQGHNDDALILLNCRYNAGSLANKHAFLRDATAEQCILYKNKGKLLYNINYFVREITPFFWIFRWPPRVPEVFQAYLPVTDCTAITMAVGPE